MLTTVLAGLYRFVQFRQIDVSSTGFPYTPNIEKCDDAPMKNSIGTESQVFVRDARNAIRASAADSGGTAVPFSALSAVQEIIRFWFGQMIPHTLNNITNPIAPPIPIE